jgi:hypothetical protein
LTFGTWEDNYANEKYESLLTNTVLAAENDTRDLQKEGRNFVLSDNDTEAPYNFNQGRFYGQNGPGTWKNEVEKSGCVRTFIPAIELVTETYTQECEEGAAKECNCVKSCEHQNWHLKGNID